MPVVLEQKIQCCCIKDSVEAIQLTQFLAARQPTLADMLLQQRLSRGRHLFTQEMHTDLEGNKQDVAVQRAMRK